MDTVQIISYLSLTMMFSFVSYRTGVRNGRIRMYNCLMRGERR